MTEDLTEGAIINAIKVSKEFSTDMFKFNNDPIHRANYNKHIKELLGWENKCQ